MAKSQLTLSSIRASFSIEKQYDGVGFNNAAATIVGGFALHTKSGWLLWGQFDDSGTVMVLNLSITKESNVIGISSEIDSFTEKYGLYLVDWPRLFWGGPDKLKFSEYSK